MELNEFITKILVDVSLGIKNANKKVDGQPFIIESYKRENERGYISFDIGVTASEKKENGSSGGIQVQFLNIGGKNNREESKENYNRIKFFVLTKSDIK